MFESAPGLDWTDLIKTILTGLGGAGALWLGYLFDRWRKKDEHKIHATDASEGRFFVAVTTTPDVLDALVTSGIADRVLCFNAHGETTFEKLFVWHAYPATGFDKQFQPKTEYHGISTDGHYRTMLDALEADRYAHLVTKRMPDSMLKGLYETEHVAETIVGFLDIEQNIEGKRFLYCSVGKYEGSFTKSDIVKIKTAIDRCRNKFNG